MKITKTGYFVAGLALLFASTSQAALVSVVGPASSAGAPAEIIAAPSLVIDDPPGAINLGMQGFNESQGVLLAADLAVDGGIVSAGTRVDSHMIFLNTRDTQLTTHSNVIWEFTGQILGVMSDSGGTLESASSAFLGALGTVYPSAFPARGMEGGDSYLIAGSLLNVTMQVTEPGDWIRVVTASAVPVPAAVWLFGSALLGLVGFGRRKPAS